MSNATDRPDPHVDLPEDLADHLAAATGMAERPGTLTEVVSHVEQLAVAADSAATASDLYTDGETRHEVHLDGGVRHAPCVLDALVGAVLADAAPVPVRSTDPETGGTVTFEVRGGGVSVTPADAVVSYGLAAELPSPDGAGNPWAGWLESGTFDEVTEHVCAYVNAFESTGSYERWDRGSDAVSTPVTAGQATALARRLAAGPLFE